MNEGRTRKRYPTVCPACGGAIAERTVTLDLPDGEGRPRLIQGVPAGVCDQCGEQYLTAAVTEILDRVLAVPPARHEEVPVWEFAPSA